MGLEQSAPLATQLVRLLRERLRQDYPDGGRIPSEPDIAAEFNVSRGTVRQALAVLEREGIVVRKQGSGTFVNMRILQVSARIEHAYEFSDLIRRAGYNPSIALVEVAKERVDQAIASRLETAADAEVLAVRKVFLADNEPIIYCTDVLPTQAIREPYDEAELRDPIFAFLRQRCKLTVDYYLSEIIADLADEQVAAKLGCQLMDAVLRLDETAYDKTHKPVLFSKTYFRPSQIRFAVLRKKL